MLLADMILLPCRILSRSFVSFGSLADMKTCQGHVRLCAVELGMPAKGQERIFVVRSGAIVRSRLRRPSFQPPIRNACRCAARRKSSADVVQDFFGLEPINRKLPRMMAGPVACLPRQ